MPEILVIKARFSSFKYESTSRLYILMSFDFWLRRKAMKIGMMDAKSNSLFEIKFFGGTLKYFVDKNGDAVIVDYIGENEILFIPTDLGIFNIQSEESIPVANYIPDEAFQSCTKVKTVIFGTSIKLGLFLFENCEFLSNIVCIDGFAKFDEFTFTDRNYTPRKINTYELITENYGADCSDNHCFDSFECYNLITSIIMECSESTEHKRLTELVSLENIGNSIEKAIIKDSVQQLLFIESLGIKIEPQIPFVLETTNAIKHKAWNVLDFLLSRKIFTSSWEEGSLLYVAATSGQLNLVIKSLEAGVSPFSRSPEWDGARLVSDIVKELHRNDMFEALSHAQEKYGG